MNKFKIGDKVTTNPSCDEKIYWWDKYKGSIMTITKEIEVNSEIHYHVKENGVLWAYYHLVPYKSFDFHIDDNEFKI